MKKIFLSNILLFVVGLLSGQTNTENYIQNTTCLDADCIKKTETIQYFDLLGRPRQIISIKASPTGKDLVTPIVYDDFGRQTREYLAVPQSSTSNANIYTQNSGLISYPVSDVVNIYGGEKIYTEKVLESSPLQRVLQQKQIGNDWANKPVTYTYDVNNQADQVKKYETSTSWDITNKAYGSQMLPVSNYAVGELTKNTATDEDGNKTIEFKDGFGQTVLIRKVMSSTNYADTYYVYNEYMKLVYVVPPLASVAPTLDDTILNNLCYQYKYDNRKRLVEKKLPGKSWEYMLYDKQDRIVATQDANLRANRQWMFTKYDQFGRVAITGISTGSDTRVTEQNLVDTSGNNSVKRTAFVVFSRQNMDVYYDNPDGSYPASVQLTTVLSLNYYDIYPPLTGITLPSSIINQEVLKQPGQSTTGRNTKNLPLATYLKNIEDDNWTKNYTFYDNKARAIGTYSVNHLGGYTKVENELDFAGIIKQTKTYHKRLDTDTEKVITETFEYDDQNRVKKHWHQVNSLPQELLTENSYNEISQLTGKKVGNNLQNINYTYNIRGWMTKINDPANLNGKLFGYEVKYNNPVSTSLSSGKYNGNIAEIDWKTSQDDVLRRYSYQYDALNRLKNAVYSEPNSSVPQSDLFNETMDYDLNGNIASLQRNSKGLSGMAEQIDNLIYHYTGNRLTSVNDTSTNYRGYPDVSGNTIAYDDNGNMTDQKDKGILLINYNILNLPSLVKFDKLYLTRGIWQNVNSNYTYRADGVKVKKVYKYSENSVFKQKTTEYLDGFQYEIVSTSSDPVIKFIPTSEGYFNFENNKYIYQYKDQLGNIRVSYYKDSNGNTVVDKESNYYPFGMEHDGYNSLISSTLSYKYSFQEQEQQEETGWNFFKWRNYDSTIGRFFNIDPLSEKYAYQSHYNFSENKVVAFRELEGLEAINSEFVRKVFNNNKIGKSYYMVVNVDQPGKGGDRDTYEGSPVTGNTDVGHTFITLIRNNTDGTKDSTSFGFYPSDGVRPGVKNQSPGELHDNAGHEKEVLTTFPISQQGFNNILNFVEDKKNTMYDLNTNNCTDFGLGVAKAAGYNTGTWPLGSGSNPGDLGEDMRELNQNIRNKNSKSQKKNSQIQNKDNENNNENNKLDL